MQRRGRTATQGVGVFVFSQRTAPCRWILESLARYGDNVVVVWDAEDSATDAYLVAALSSRPGTLGANRESGITAE